MKKVYLFLALLFSLPMVQATAQCTATITPASSVAICAGNTATLSANTGTSYQWQMNGNYISGATNQSYNASVAASYTVIVYNGSCNATSAAVTVVVNPMPTANIVVSPSANVCIGTSVQICATGNAITYQWLYNNVNIVGSTNSCATFNTAGSYTLKVANTFGCIATYSAANLTFSAPPATVVASSNSPVAIGDTISLTSSSATSGVTYSWVGPNGYTSTQQNPNILNATTNMGGIYTVQVSSNGCSASFSTTVIVSDLVWPGDVNYDLTVDNSDVLALGVNYGQTGVVRAGGNLNWIGQYCANWANYQMANQVNMKHADCNGDGTVNSTDQAAITQNYALVHVRDEHHAAAKITGLPDLYFDTQGVSFTPGTTVTIPIKLGSTATGFTQFYGVAAQIKISGLTLTAPMQVTYTNSWIGNASNTLRFTKDVTNDRLDWAYVRNDHQNVDGSGTIGELVFAIPSNAPTSQVTLHFDNVKMIDKNAAIYTNYFNVLDNTSYVSATAVPQANRLINAAAIVPNPSHGEAAIQLTLSAATDMQVTITDASGKTVWNKTVNGIAGKQNIELPVANIASGVYQVALKSKDGKAVQMLKWINEAK